MAKLLSAYGYLGDAMNLPVADVDTAGVFYVQKMGFTVVETADEPVKKAVLERDGIQFAIAENSGNPEQDGCAFHVDDVEALRNEFIAKGTENIGKAGHETRSDEELFRVFFVVAPDGLCYWFGQRE